MQIKKVQGTETEQDLWSNPAFCSGRFFEARGFREGAEYNSHAGISILCAVRSFNGLSAGRPDLACRVRPGDLVSLASTFLDLRLNPEDTLCGRDSAKADGALNPRHRLHSEVGKQSKKTLLDIFGHYIEGCMTLFDTM